MPHLKISGWLIMALLLTNTLLSSCAYNNYRSLDREITASGVIEYDAIPEASGLAVSHRNKDVLWVINDGGNGPAVFAVAPSGRYLGSFHIAGADNHDWEDLASFTAKGESYLLIADVGDNKGEKKQCYIHLVKEPELRQLKEKQGISIRPERTIVFTYPDGPRDCESVAVDAAHEKILLLSKRDTPPILYELPLWSSGRTVATRLGTIRPFPKPSQYYLSPPDFFDYTTLPTAMDISADGLSAIVLTYANAYYYQRSQPAEPWPDVFAKRPHEILLPSLRQAESICFSEDGNNIFITSEKLPAPLLKVNIRQGLDVNK